MLDKKQFNFIAVYDLFSLRKMSDQFRNDKI